MNKISHLILSSTIDFSTDYVCYELEQRGKSYLRLNRDRFSQYRVRYDVDTGEMVVRIKGTDYLISHESLKSVFFRHSHIGFCTYEIADNRQIS